MRDLGRQKWIEGRAYLCTSNCVEMWVKTGKRKEGQESWQLLPLLLPGSPHCSPLPASLSVSNLIP